MKIYFFEYSGEEAKEKLNTLQSQLESLPTIHTTRLLKNTKQAGLFLLVVEASEEPHPALPEGVKVWAFEEVSEFLV
jgi:hypothetical protein